MDDNNEGLNFKKLIDDLDSDGTLDEAGLTHDLLELYEALNDSGLPANDPMLYRTMIATMTLIVTIENQGVPWESAIEWTGRLVTRALRDLTDGQG